MADTRNGPELHPMTEELASTGANFAAATGVHFGTKLAPKFTLIDSTKMTVVTPSHAVGTVNVTVNNAKGASPVVTADKYTFT